MVYEACPSFNDFSVEIAHYESKLSIVNQQLEDAIKTMVESGILAEDGWGGKAGNAAKDKIQELIHAMKVPCNDLDDALGQLRVLKNAIDEQIRILQEEWEKQQAQTQA